jgi:GT2 family glycosyltransferase
MSKTVRIVIPSYQKPEQLERCYLALEKCKEYLSKANDEIHVVIDTIDNNEINLGFSKAVNQGLRRAIKEGNEYAILLNQDCYLFDDAVATMVDFMETHPKCFHASIKQISSTDPDAIIHGGTLDCYPTGKHIGGSVQQNDCSVSARMPWANAACVIVNVGLIPDVGLLDENMVLIGCDSDWSYRARALGFEVWYIGEAACIHEQGVTRGTNLTLQKQMYLDMIYWRTKWIGADLYRELSMEVFD